MLSQPSSEPTAADPSPVADAVKPRRRAKGAKAASPRGRRKSAAAEASPEREAIANDNAENDNNEVILLSQLPPAMSLGPPALAQLPPPAPLPAQLPPPLPPAEPAAPRSDRLALDALLDPESLRAFSPEEDDPPTGAPLPPLPELGAPSLFPQTSIPIVALPLPDEIEEQRATPVPRPATDFPPPPPSPALASLEALDASDAAAAAEAPPAETPAPAAAPAHAAPTMDRKALAKRVGLHGVVTLLCALLGARLGGWGAAHPAPATTAAHDEHSAHTTTSEHAATTDPHGAPEAPHDEHAPAASADAGARAPDEAITLSANVAATRRILAAFGVARTATPPPPPAALTDAVTRSPAPRPQRRNVIPPNPYVFGRLGAAQLSNLDVLPPMVPPAEP